MVGSIHIICITIAQVGIAFQTSCYWTSQDLQLGKLDVIFFPFGIMQNTSYHSE